VSATDPARAWRRAAGARPLVLGHRGARHAAPENTLAAFDLARREGADGVELDVRLDGDRRVLVLHDPSFERVTAGREARLAARLSRRAIDGIDVGRGERAPSLAAVLDWARAHRQRINVELKHDVPDRLGLARAVTALLVTEPEAAERFLCSSFDPLLVLAMRRLAPCLPTAWLVHAKQRALRTAPARGLLGTSGVHPEHVLVTRETVAHYRRADGLLNVWTVNDETRARELAGLGVDALISDRPGAILAALGAGRRAEDFGT
jgi:glycerophosphoryl diester phosphodiesterase